MSEAKVSNSLTNSHAAKFELFAVFLNTLFTVHTAPPCALKSA